METARRRCQPGRPGDRRRRLLRRPSAAAVHGRPRGQSAGLSRPAARSRPGTGLHAEGGERLAGRSVRGRRVQSGSSRRRRRSGGRRRARHRRHGGLGRGRGAGAAARRASGFWCWARRAPSGSVAVQAARLLGAGRIVAAGRDGGAAGAGAPSWAPTRSSTSARRRSRGGVPRCFPGGGPDVVIDPLWGAPALAAMRMAPLNTRLDQPRPVGRRRARRCRPPPSAASGCRSSATRCSRRRSTLWPART